MSKKIVLKPVSELKVRLTGLVTLPDPAKIESTGDWYYLDHVSSGLIAFDSEKKKFMPLMVEGLSTEQNGIHRFTLKQGVKFHDGTPITAKDVLWTIKRQLMLKTSTHFRLWEYVVGCEHLKSLNQECDGLRAVSESEIEIRLKVRSDSFFLQLASPETGIWAASDMNPKTAELNATKFSGAYFVEEVAEDFATLRRNENSPISQKFFDSPRAIRLMRMPLTSVNEALTNKTIDLTVRSYRPFGEDSWQEKGVGFKSTTPSTIIYFYGTGLGIRKPIGRDLLEAIWKQNSDEKILPASTYLPFASNYSLTKEEFLSSLPEKSAATLRILCPEGFFAPRFLDELKESAKSANVALDFYFVPSKDWFAAFEDPKTSEKYDYILSVYAASERYPTVQLRHITGDLPKAPIDLKKAESPDLSKEGEEVLKDYQKWLLHSYQAVPIFFNSTLFLHQNNLDLGEQPSSDAEIELWRVREKVLE